MAFIEVDKLEKTYIVEGVHTPALRGVSFDIKKGEFVAIMGPSGSGKSTLLHILGFLDRPSGGTYTLEGKRIDEYSDEALAKIRNEKMGFVFQMFNLLPRISVIENIKLPLIYSDVPHVEHKRRAIDAINAVGLSHRIEHDPTKLSGGERQRVAIARALVMNSPIIFADEPTGNLDSKSGGDIMEIISSLNDHGHTIILITHETYTAEYAGRILQLKDGKLVSDELNGRKRIRGRQLKK